MVAPPRILEIQIISAHDLAVVSKNMKSYVVVWVDPERKLTSKVNLEGQDNPTWNEKFVFRVDDRFLCDETSCINIEIYTAAWVKDALIGTVKVLTSHLFGTLLNTTSTTRHVALQVRRPSGRPQGLINLGVTLLDNSMRSMPLSIDASNNNTRVTEEYSELTEDYTHKIGNNNNDEKPPKLIRSQSDKTDLTSEDYYRNDEAMKRIQYLRTNEDSSVVDDGMKGGSMCSSDVGPSASVVAAAIAKGLYRVPVQNKERSAEEVELDSKLQQWKSELPPPAANAAGGHEHSKTRSVSKHGGRSRRKSDTGLFSCFGNAFGCEISITCGGSNNKKKGNNGKVGNLSSVDGTTSVTGSSYV